MGTSCSGSSSGSATWPSAARPPPTAAAEAAGSLWCRMNRFGLEFDYMYEDELGPFLGVDAADEDFAGAEDGEERPRGRAAAAAHRDCSTCPARAGRRAVRLHLSSGRPA